MVSYRSVLLAIGFLSASGRQAWADTKSVSLSCDFDNGSMQTGCSLKPVDLAGPQDYESTFLVDYLFHCSGHHIELGLTTEDGFKALELSEKIQRLAIDGKSFLKLSVPAPQRLYAAVIAKDCQITISRMSVVPADSTLQGWQVEARLTSEAIKDALDTWLLSQNLDRVMSFDATQMAHVVLSTKDSISGLIAEGGITWDQLINPASGRFWNAANEAAHLPSGWNDVVSLHPDLSDLMLLHVFAKDVLQGRPSAHTPKEAEAAAHNVEGAQALRYLTKLKSKIRAGQELVNRANHSIKELSGDLEILSKSLSQAKDDFPPLN